MSPIVYLLICSVFLEGGIYISMISAYGSPIIIIMVGPTIAENSCFSMLHDCMLNASRYENGRWSDHPEIPDSRLRRRDGDRSIVLLMNNYIHLKLHWETHHLVYTCGGWWKT